MTKIQHRKSARRRAQGLAALLLASASACSAQEAPAATAPAVPASAVPAPLVVLDEGALGVEKSLQVAVTFEARRQKLPEALAALQAQSGVALTLAPQSPFASKLLTARASKMPLAQVMSSLSHLYGASWARRGAAFEMVSNGLSAVDNAAWKFQSARSNLYGASQQDAINWQREAQRLGATRLAEPQGVPFAELSPDITRQIRARVEDEALVELGTTLDSLSVRAISDWTLQLSTPEEGRLALSFLLPDGREVGLDNFEVGKPDAR